MAKKHFSYEDEYDEDEELLLDRKAKRKRERELSRQRQQAEEAAEPQAPKDDTMSQVVALCQENRWREADVLCLNAIQRYQAEGKSDSEVAISVALQKIDRSLRRQMLAAFISEAEKMMNKE